MTNRTIPNTIPLGYCQCGCGQKTEIARWNSRSKGWIAGQPKRFIHGHNAYFIERPKRSRYASESVAFWQHVVTPADASECWNWNGTINAGGYGEIKCGKFWLAHRLSYHLHFGPFPAHLHVLHHCDNPACVNPHHLFLGTNDDNIRDMLAKGRQSRGESKSSLTEDDIRAIRSARRSGETQPSIASRYNVDPSTISLIVHRKRWKHIE